MPAFHDPGQQLLLTVEGLRRQGWWPWSSVPTAAPRAHERTTTMPDGVDEYRKEVTERSPSMVMGRACNRRYALRT
jgi:hypothetical protein